MTPAELAMNRLAGAGFTAEQMPFVAPGDTALPD